MSQLAGTWRKQAGLTPSSGDYAALNTVIFMGLLLVQFGLGMGINLFTGITRHHAGTGAANIVPGVFDSGSGRSRTAHRPGHPRGVRPASAGFGLSYGQLGTSHLGSAAYAPKR